MAGRVIQKKRESNFKFFLLSSSSSDSDSSAGSLDSAGASAGKQRTSKRRGGGSRGGKKGGGGGGARGSPELLKPGCWKYKPNGFELSQLSDDDNIWMQDDVTLKVEALKGNPYFRGGECIFRGDHGRKTIALNIFW